MRGIKVPSAARLCTAFPQLEREQALLIRKLAHVRDEPERLGALLEKECPETDAYRRRCYNDPLDSRMWRTTLVLHAIDLILGTSGVEVLGEPEDFRSAPPYEYCNTGDSYGTTLVYHRDADAIRIGSWADIAERMPEKGEG